MTIPNFAFAALCLAPPAGAPAPVAEAPVAEAPVSAPATTSEDRVLRDADSLKGEILLGAVDFYAQGARRDRFVRSGIGLGLAGTQLGLGVYGLVGFEGEGIRRSAGTQMIAGGVGVVVSIVDLSVRSPMERLRRSDDYAALVADPGNRLMADQVEMSWRMGAKKARKRRLVLGSISTLVGTGLTAVGAVQLGRSNSDTPADERLWAYTTVFTGLGVMTSGLVSIILLGEEERSFAAYEAGLTPLRRRVVRLSPGFGGLSLSGRF